MTYTLKRRRSDLPPHPVIAGITNPWLTLEEFQDKSTALHEYEQAHPTLMREYGVFEGDVRVEIE